MARAQEIRQIAPEQFAPMYSEPNAPQHKLPPPPPPPPPPAPEPAPPAAVVDKPPPAVVSPSRDKPYGACDPEGREFIVCLGGAVELADRAVERSERSALAGLQRRPDVNPVLADGAARGLRAAGDAWRLWRDRECADLPLIETGLTGSLYQKRLICRIRRDVDRVEALRARYGAEADPQ